MRVAAEIFQPIEVLVEMAGDDALLQLDQLLIRFRKDEQRLLVLVRRDNAAADSRAVRSSEFVSR